MFGNKIVVTMQGMSVTLKALCKKDMEKCAIGMQDLEVRKYLSSMYGPTLEQEYQWIERASEKQGEYLWGIYPDGEELAIGSTGLHNINQSGRSAVSGIVIWDKAWWGKGITSRAHIARTWYGANYLNLATITSHVKAPNIASRKALEKVGYTVTGTEYRSNFIDGKYVDMYLLTWINPYEVGVLFPEGVPDILNAGICNARKTLQLAKEVISF